MVASEDVLSSYNLPCSNILQMLQENDVHIFKLKGAFILLAALHGLARLNVLVVGDRGRCLSDTTAFR